MNRMGNAVSIPLLILSILLILSGLLLLFPMRTACYAYLHLDRLGHTYTQIAVCFPIPSADLQIQWMSPNLRGLVGGTGQTRL